MKLRELDAQFIAYREETKQEMLARGVAIPSSLFMRVSTLREAHGIRFICPKSFTTNAGMVGAHLIQVFFVGSPVPNNIGVNKAGEPVRWSVSGTSLDDLALLPSIREEGLCGWHGFVGSNGVEPGSAS